jgi:hypothetical protein
MFDFSIVYLVRRRNDICCIGAPAQGRHFFRAFYFGIWNRLGLLMLMPISIWIGRWSKRLRLLGLAIVGAWILVGLLFPADI